MYRTDRNNATQALRRADEEGEGMPHFAAKLKKRAQFTGTPPPEVKMA